MGYISNNTIGILSSAPDGKIISKVFGFVECVLKDLIGSANDNENYLTNELCKKLSFKKPPEFPFFFHHQNIENANENTSTDFAVFATYSYAREHNKKGEEFPMVKFEAKRLCSTLPKKREREYVIGEYDKGKQTKNSGGIERFKNLRHGDDVAHVAIIGYVQTETFEYWEKRINNFVKSEVNSPHDSTLIWDDDDYLKRNSTKPNLCNFTSKPKRRSSLELNMNHIWINLVSEKPHEV